MEQYFKLRDSVKTILERLFPEAAIEFHRIEYGGKVTTVFIRFSSIELIESQWEDISNAIALYYQTKVESEFERWNLYLFYLSPVVLEKGLKYKIENDPISSRKIVVDKFDGALSQAAMEKIISSHITNSNLTIDNEEPVPTPFVKDAPISNILDKIIVDNEHKKKKNVDYDDLLNKIERSFRNEI
jgi:hypothetical protein